jgi:hypothetical protein
MGLRASATFRPSNTASFVSRIASGAADGVLNAVNAGQAISQSIVPVRTGELRDDISVKSGLEDTSAWAAWGPDSVLYRYYVEFGTGKRGAASAGAGPGPYSSTWPGMVAQPYQRPAMDEMRGQAVDIVAASIKSAL